MIPCPDKCDCRNGKTECFNASLNSIPKPLDKNINRLNISHNNITILKNGDLDGLGNLKSVWMNNNGIETVQPEVFCATHNLTTLDLRNNKLTLIQPELFRCLKELKHLYLNNNTITYIDLSIFENHTKLLVVDLSDNGIRTIEPNKLANNKLICLLNTQNNFIKFPLDWTGESYKPFNVLDIYFTGTCSWSVTSYQRLSRLDTMRQTNSSEQLNNLYESRELDLSHMFKSRLQGEVQDDIYLIYNSTMDAVTTTSGIFLFCHSASISVWFWCNDNPYRNFDILFEKCSKKKNETSEPRRCKCDCSIAGNNEWLLAGSVILVVFTILAFIRVTVLVTRFGRCCNRRNK
jgi:hypothetical protein